MAAQSPAAAARGIVGEGGAGSTSPSGGPGSIAESRSPQPQASLTLPPPASPSRSPPSTRSDAEPPSSRPPRARFCDDVASLPPPDSAHSAAREGGCDSSRCRHLQERMFPRWLSLDCKRMDEFGAGRAKAAPNDATNLGRIYVEALHLKDFLKSPEAIAAQNESASKGSGKRGRKGTESPPKKKGRSSPSKKKGDELVTDNVRLSQSYFGGLEGKRTWFLANGHRVGKGGGVAGSYCQALDASTPGDVGAGEESNVIFPKRGGAASKGGTSARGALDDLLAAEVKLALLRKAMRLHDQTVPLGNPEEADPELRRLQNLIEPVQGYAPPSSELETAFRTSAYARGKEKRASLGNVSRDRSSAVFGALDATLPSCSGKASSNEWNERMGPVPSKLHTSPEANFDRAVREGKEASLAANLLLEAFRRNRRNFWASKLKKRPPPKCAWCPVGCSAFTNATAKSNSKFGVINDSAASPDEGTLFRTREIAGDALIQCLECDLVGCAPRSLGGGEDGSQHAMLHFLMSGHRWGVTCGRAGEVFCMGCGDVVYHECFDLERERIFVEHHVPSLSWRESPIIRGVDPSSFMITPENGVVWSGLKATYPTPVPAQLVHAARFAAKRIAMFRGGMVERSMEPGVKADERHLKGRWIPKPVGVYNLGNTCFMTAILQCMLHCKPLQDLFFCDLVHPYQSCQSLRCRGDKTCLACELDKTFLEYYGSANGVNAIATLEEQTEFPTEAISSYARNNRSDVGNPIVPANLLAEIWRNKGMRHLAGHGQHDSQEFFNAFLDSLATHSITYHKTANNMRQFMSPGTKYDADLLTNKFMGTLRSVLICKKCGCKRAQTEKFSNVSLPLAKELSCTETDAKTRRGKISVRSILNHFTRAEDLADPVFCPSCNFKTKTLKQTTFSKIPEVLCLHMKRFDSAANRKITEFVSFPAHGLDMGRYLPHWCERGLEMKEQSGQHNAESPAVLYDLFGTVNHRGTLHQGHYTANVKCGDCWYSCNDAFVTKAGESGGEKEVLSNTAAYMLFYIKR